MGAQRQLLGALGSLLGAVNVATSAVKKARQKQAKAKEKASKKAEKASKQSYEKEANIKQENKQIVNNIAKPEVGSFGIENVVAAQQEDKQKQKFILSEEGATYPVTAENSQTNIPIDEDVKTLNVVKSKAKQRSLAQIAGAKKAGQARAEVWRRANSLGVDHPEDYEFRNVTANYDWKEIQALGITKTELKTWAMEASVGNGNEVAEKVNNRLGEYGIYIDPDQLNTDLYDQIESGISQAVEMNRMKAKEEEMYKDDEEELQESSSSTTYTVWEPEEQPDYKAAHPEWEGKTRQEIFDSFVF